MLLWASAFVVIRDSVDEISPGGLALGRMLVASLALVGLLLVRREGLLPSRAAWPGIVGSGLLWLTVYVLALNYGEQRVDAGTAALVVGVGPILIALLAGRLLKEGFPARLWAGIAVSFAGAAVVGFSISDKEGASTLGVVLCLIAAAGFAGGMVSQKFALRHASALQITTFGCIVASIALLPFAGQLVDDVTSSSTRAGLSIVYLGVLPTAVAFSTWAYALTRISAGKLGSTTYAVPAVTVALSWLFLDEVPPWLAVAGGALCLGGVAVTRSKASLPNLRLFAAKPTPAQEAVPS